MENWLASALPVADAVSFKFDDINVTAQRVMTQTAPLMLAFYDQFIKDYRGSQVTAQYVCMSGQVSEKWDINGS